MRPAIASVIRFAAAPNAKPHSNDIRILGFAHAAASQCPATAHAPAVVATCAARTARTAAVRTDNPAAATAAVRTSASALADDARAFVAASTTTPFSISGPSCSPQRTCVYGRRRC